MRLPVALMAVGVLTVSGFLSASPVLVPFVAFIIYAPSITLAISSKSSCCASTMLVRSARWCERWVSRRGLQLLMGRAPAHVLTLPRTARPSGTVQHAQCGVCLHEDGGPAVRCLLLFAFYLIILES